MACTFPLDDREGNDSSAGWLAWAQVPKSDEVWQSGTSCLFWKTKIAKSGGAFGRRVDLKELLILDYPEKDISLSLMLTLLLAADPQSFHGSAAFSKIKNVKKIISESSSSLSFGSVKWEWIWVWWWGLQFLQGIMCCEGGGGGKLGKYIPHMLYIYFIFGIEFGLQILPLLPSTGECNFKNYHILNLRNYYVVNSLFSPFGIQFREF